jgi:flagellar basal body-associated protein FliL
MRKIVAISIGVVVLLAGAMFYNVWHAAQDPVTRTPGPLETWRAQLHGQFEAAKKTEEKAEQQAWNSPEQLRAMIQGHEQRIERLKDNKEAAEIVAYDHEAVDRLEKRLAQIAEEEAAKAEAAEQAGKEAQQP